MVNQCAQCGAELVAPSAMCAHCGATPSVDASVSQPTVGQGPELSPGSVSNPYRSYAIAAACVSVAFIATLIYLDARPGYKSAWIKYSVLVWWQALIPVIVGALVIAINGERAPDWMVRATAWADRRAEAARGSSGKFNRFFARPTLWVYERLRREADGLSSAVLQNGARAAALTFAFCLAFLIVCTFIALVYVAVVLAAILALFWFVLAVVASEYGGSRCSTSVSTPSWSSGESRSQSDVLTHAAGRSQDATVYRGTNMFTEEKVGRTDESGNVIRGTNFFNEEKTGRIDQDGNLFQGTNWLNEEKIGRIDGDGNVFSGANAFTEIKVGRIDEDGNILEGSNWFTERKIGRVERRS